MTDEPGMPLIVPVSHSNLRPLPIPWDIIAPHENQARINHGQTLARLRERGGVSACEAVAILNDRQYDQMPFLRAMETLADIIHKANPDAAKTYALRDGQHR